MKKNVMIVLFFVLSVICVFFPVYFFDFITLDDTAYILENPHVRDGLSFKNIHWAFTHYWASNWHPLTYISHMTDVTLFGLHPGMHHLTNIFFHLMNTLLLFCALNFMTEDRFRSFAVAFLFAFHPMHVESVAWVAERKDVLSAFFFMLTILFYSKSLRQARWRNLFLVHVFFVLGLMSKPMVITLPFVLLLLDVWPLNRISFSGSAGHFSFPGQAILTCIKEKSLLIIFSFLSAGITFCAQDTGGAVVPMDMYPLSVRVSNALVSYVKYIVKLFYPVDLSIVYPHPESFPFWLPSGAFLILLVITTGCLYFYKNKPAFIVGWLWFTGMLIPVIGLVQVGGQAMADRYSYLPYIGLFIALLWGIPDMSAKSKVYGWLQKVVFGVAAVLFVQLTSVQLGYWKNSVSLYSHAVEVTENNHFAHFSLGGAYLLEGDVKNAICHCQTAIDLRPKLSKAYICLGRAMEGKGKFEKAISYLEKALALDSRHDMAYYYIGFSLVKLKRYEDAVIVWQKLFEINPHFLNVYTNYELSLIHEGRFNDAVFFLRDKMMARPVLEDLQGDALAKIENSGLTAEKDIFNNAMELARQGRVVEAETEFKRLLGIRLFMKKAFNNLGVLGIMREKFGDAYRYLNAALQMQPDDPVIYNNLGVLMIRSGQAEGALPAFKKAVSLKKSPVFLNNLGISYTLTGKTDAALETYLKAYELFPENPMTSYLIASFYAAGKNREKTLKWLEDAFSKGFSDMVLLENDPYFISFLDADLINEKVRRR